MQKKVEGQQLGAMRLKIKTQDALYNIYRWVFREMLLPSEQEGISEDYIKELIYAVFTTNSIDFDWYAHNECGLEYIIISLISWPDTDDEAKWRRRHSMASNKIDGYLNPISLEGKMSTERRIEIAQSIVYKKINKAQIDSLQPIERIRLVDAILKDVEQRRAEQALEIYGDGCLDLSVAIPCLIDWKQSVLGFSYWDQMYESAYRFELERGTL